MNESNQNQTSQEPQSPRREFLTRGVKLAYVVPVIAAATMASNAQAQPSGGLHPLP